MKKVFVWILLLGLVMTALSACGGSSDPTAVPGTLPVITPGGSEAETTPGTEPGTDTTAQPYTNPPTRTHGSTAAPGTTAPEPETTTAEITTAPEPETTTAEAPATLAPETTTAYVPPETRPATSAPTASPTTPSSGKNGYLVCLDAGHQAHANTDQEPLGPGSSEMKTKVSSGTQGRTTGVPEYVVNLQVALKLQQILEARGYEVLMIRTTHDVNISNAERAQIANNAQVDAFVRIHCNGVDDTSVNGLLAMIQTPNNPWNGAQYAEFKRLAQCIVDEACAVTGAKNQGLLETDGMTGINWCERPTALVEMGFMTNPEEDAKLVEDWYQDLLAEGIANGLDNYFGIER
nr:N-acetylmuramoyl-L-alanine amidase [Lachnospiraceae bacterium]